MGHYTVLVTLNRDHAQTSAEARAYVNSVLPSLVGPDDLYEEMHTGPAKPIAGEGGRVGGRSSGFLTRLRLDPERLAACDRDHEAWVREGSEEGRMYSFEERRSRYDEIFFTHFPNFIGNPPTWRSWFSSREDDGAIVDAFLYDTALEPAAARAHEDPKFPAWYDLDGTPIAREAMIGKKWVVVVNVVW